MVRSPLLIGLLCQAAPVEAADLPTAIKCYQTATNVQGLDGYLDCFAKDAVVMAKSPRCRCNMLTDQQKGEVA